MLNYPHRLSHGAAHLRLTAQLALLIYLVPYTSALCEAMNCRAARRLGRKPPGRPACPLTTWRPARTWEVHADRRG
jgi:hypothetical protein